MTELAGRWLVFMVEMSVQFSLIVLLAFLVLASFHGWPPSMRYVLWLVLLVRLLVPWGLRGPAGVLPSPHRTLATLEVDADRMPLDRVVGASTNGQDSQSRSPNQSSGFPSGAGSLVLFLGWFAGVLVFGGAVGYRARSLRRELQRCSLPVPGDLSSRLDVLAKRAGLSRTPQLWLIGDEMDYGPALVGVAKPRIVLPASLLVDRPRQEIDCVLLHELVHIKRRDPWALYVEWLVQALYFFHPLVWVARRRLREERECACDDAVARLQEERAPYVRVLLDLASRPSGHQSGAAGLGVSEPGTALGRRLSRMLSQDYDPDRRAGGLVWMALGPVALAVFALAAFRPPPAEPEPGSSATTEPGARSAKSAPVESPVPELASELDPRDTGAPAWIEALVAMPETQNLGLVTLGAEARRELFRFFRPKQATEMPQGPERMLLELDDRGALSYGGGCFGCRDLRTLLRMLGWHDHDVRGDQTLLAATVSGDLVVRESASRGALLPDLERLLATREGLRVELRVELERLESVVLRGRVGRPAGDSDDLAKRVIRLAVGNPEQGDDEFRGALETDAMPTLVSFFEIALGMPVIDETTEPIPGPITVRLYESAFAVENRTSVLRTLAEQMHLDWAIERRASETIHLRAR